MKKPEAVRLEQAPSAVSRLFRDCFAILGLLRRPTPDSRGLIAKHGINTLILVHTKALLDQWVQRIGQFLTIDDVPERWREAVQALLDADED